MEKTMTDNNYLITLECNQSALAKLIAAGLENDAVVTDMRLKVSEAVNELPQPAAPVARQDDPVATQRFGKSGRKLGFASPKMATKWDVYRVMVDEFYPGKQFRGKDLDIQCKRRGMKLGCNAAAAHLHKFRASNVVQKIGGHKKTGFVHVVNRVMTKVQLERAVSNGR